PCRETHETWCEEPVSEVRGSGDPHPPTWRILQLGHGGRCLVHAGERARHRFVVDAACLRQLEPARRPLDQPDRKLALERRARAGWLGRPVTDDQLRRIYDLMKWGPTSANSSPARLLFLRSRAAKERLAPALAPQNVEKTLQAPVTAIVAHDLRFYDELPRLFPHVDARSWFVGNEQLVEATAFRNGSLQGAYLILAARAIGLDAGPMSGFDNEKVDREFFPDGRLKSNFP